MPIATMRTHCPRCRKPINIVEESEGTFTCPECDRNFTIEVDKTVKYKLKPAYPDRPPKVFIVPNGYPPPPDFDPDYDAMIRPYNQRNN